MMNLFLNISPAVDNRFARCFCWKYYGLNTLPIKLSSFQRQDWLIKNNKKFYSLELIEDSINVLQQNLDNN